MNKQDNLNIIIFLFLWSTIVAILFLHTSGKVDFKLLHFTQSTGGLVMIKDSYKANNILGLRHTVFVVPHGVPFVHPKRKAKMKRYGILEAYSLQEAERIIDAGNYDIEPRLIPVEQDFLGFDLYKLGEKFYGVPTQGEPEQYSERFVGNSLKEAKDKITAIWKSRQ